MEGRDGTLAADGAVEMGEGANGEEDAATQRFMKAAADGAQRSQLTSETSLWALIITIS